MIAALAIVMGSLFVMTYTLALDTHPLMPTDPSGIDIFYLMLVATIVGFITVFQTRALAGGLPLRRWTGFVVAFALAASLALTLVEGPILDRLDIPVLEVWGILALHLLAVASFASLMVFWSAGGRSSRPFCSSWCWATAVGWRGVAAAAAGAVRVHLAVASVGRDRHLASRRDLLPRQRARAADPRLGGRAAAFFAAMLVASYRRGTSPGGP